MTLSSHSLQELDLVLVVLLLQVGQDDAHGALVELRVAHATSYPPRSTPRGLGLDARRHPESSAAAAQRLSSLFFQLDQGADAGPGCSYRILLLAIGMAYRASLVGLLL